MGGQGHLAVGDINYGEGVISQAEDQAAVGVPAKLKNSPVRSTVTRA